MSKFFKKINSWDIYYLVVAAVYIVWRILVFSKKG